MLDMWIVFLILRCLSELAEQHDTAAGEIDAP
jgi:hypothetical protein